MPDIHTIYQSIEQRIKWLEEKTKELSDAGNVKALAIGDYDKAIAIATARLSLGNVKEVCGIAVEGKPTAAAIKELAKGMCSEERVAQEIAINAYKAVITKIEVFQASLNGYQSLFRHLQ